MFSCIQMSHSSIQIMLILYPNEMFYKLWDKCAYLFSTGFFSKFKIFNFQDLNFQIKIAPKIGNFWWIWLHGIYQHEKLIIWCFLWLVHFCASWAPDLFLMAMKNGRFLYDLCIKNLQIYGQRASKNVLAAAYFFAILPNCQHPKPNCALHIQI